MSSSENTCLRGGDALISKDLRCRAGRSVREERSHRSEGSYFAAPAGGDVPLLSPRAAASARRWLPAPSLIRQAS